ncbi:unnamed protein product [Echinostoma caproni]|uniref:ATPase_AAA_core domain-containing protein n=1 Tax=Echinostoma caproni TaxID=27848 RepID=A0A183AT30_9TREM|nr:unnamed protein product [Echinostoma caproni]
MQDRAFQSVTTVCEQYQDVRAIICDEPNLLFNASDSKQSPSRRRQCFEEGSKKPSNISSPTHNANGFNGGTSAIPVVKDIRGYPVDFEMPSVTIAVSLAVCKSAKSYLTKRTTVHSSKD